MACCQGEDDNRDNSLMDSFQEEGIAEVNQRDDGYIELVLRVLAHMCDGQHRGLQVGQLVNYQLMLLEIFFFYP